jgi:hypothetical protein
VHAGVARCLAVHSAVPGRTFSLRAVAQGHARCTIDAQGPCGPLHGALETTGAAVPVHCPGVCRVAVEIGARSRVGELYLPAGGDHLPGLPTGHAVR